MSYKWLKNYEKSRHKKPKEPNESWLNSRFGPQNMDWKIAQNIYLPSVDKTVGQSWNALKRLWKNYKRNNRIGESNSQTAYDISRYQVTLDIPRSDFPELEGVISDHEFDDQQVDESLKPNPEEWSQLDQVLTREEQESEAEAEAEMDDWWVSD